MYIYVLCRYYYYYFVHTYIHTYIHNTYSALYSAPYTQDVLYTQHYISVLRGYCPYVRYIYTPYCRSANAVGAMGELYGDGNAAIDGRDHPGGRAVRGTMNE